MPGLSDLVNSIFPGAGNLASSGTVGSANTNPIGSSVGGIIGSFFGNPEAGMVAGSLLSQALSDDVQTVPGTGGGGAAGGPVAMAAGAIAIPALVRQAIIALAQRLGGSGSVVAYGRRVWETLAAWARANPGTSVLTILTGLGLTAEMASAFMAWGATQRRRRRSRGISGRDLRTTRRTVRKVVAISRQLSQLTHHHSYSRRGSVTRTSIVKA